MAFRLHNERLLEMRVGDVIAMVALVIVLAVAVLIGANFQAAVNSLGLTGQANETATTVFQNMYTGLTIGSIGIIVAAAVGIISLILGALGGVGRPTE
jgi:hypothetical protein